LKGKTHQGEKPLKHHLYFLILRGLGVYESSILPPDLAPYMYSIFVAKAVPLKKARTEHLHNIFIGNYLRILTMGVLYKILL